MRVWGLLCFGAPLMACYEAEIDPLLEATYVCEVDSDCARGQQCVLELCSDGTTQLGPLPEVLGPESLQVFPSGQEVTVPVVVGGMGLTLQPPGGDNEIGVGHIEVRVDGQPIETLTAGTLEARVQTAPVTLPSGPGLHRIEAVARQNDGTVYPTPGAISTNAVWVDDGQEHVAFLKPAPNTEVGLGEGADLRIEVVTLNFSLVNPGFVPTDSLEAPGQGHVHVFFNRNVPDCLPDCNFAYESTGFPQMSARVNFLEITTGILLSGTPGTFPLELVAQDSAHNPYRRQETDELVVDVVPLVVVAR